jgi:hypothetical protein
MIKLSINGQEREGIDEGWIAQRVQGLRRDGQAVCVRVTVKTDRIDLTTTAGVCPPGQLGGRRPRPDEERIFEAWAGCQLGADFSPGRLIQCVKRLEREL